MQSVDYKDRRLKDLRRSTFIQSAFTSLHQTYLVTLPCIVEYNSSISCAKDIFLFNAISRSFLCVVTRTRTGTVGFLFLVGIPAEYTHFCLYTSDCIQVIPTSLVYTCIHGIMLYRAFFQCISTQAMWCRYIERKLLEVVSVPCCILDRLEMASSSHRGTDFRFGAGNGDHLHIKNKKTWITFSSTITTTNSKTTWCLFLQHHSFFSCGCRCCFHSLFFHKALQILSLVFDHGDVVLEANINR